jgi:predicted amidohydrolase
MPNLTIAAVQSVQYWEEKEKNLAHFDNLLKQNSIKNIDVLVFPEMFHTGFSMHPERLFEEMENSMGINWLTNTSKRYNCLSIASLIIREEGKYFNRMVAVYPDGKIEYYDKRYLFSFAGEDKVYTAGNQQKIITYKNWNILLQVCFDLRFPENCRNQLLNPQQSIYDLVIYIANWPKKRIHHWENLLMARAIENQVYCLGVNRVGQDGNQHEYNGKSKLISPYGKVIQEADENKEHILCTTIHAHEIEKIRVEMNFLKDKK